MLHLILREVSKHPSSSVMLNVTFLANIPVIMDPSYTSQPQQCKVMLVVPGGAKMQLKLRLRLVRYTEV